MPAPAFPGLCGETVSAFANPKGGAAKSTGLVATCTPAPGGTPIREQTFG